MFAPRPAETATAPTTAAPPTAIAPPAFSVVGAILFPGRKPALTLRVGGELRTLAEGDILEGYRVERIERERVVLVHVQSGSRVERGYGESDSSSPAPVVAAVSPASGPFAPPVSSVAPVPAQAAATTSTPSAPSAPYVAPRPPPGATVHDNPLVGAIIPSSPGQSPPGMSGPRPVPLAPGQAPPPGPVALPVPPNAQGPTSR